MRNLGRRNERENREYSPRHPITRNVENPRQLSYDVLSRGGSTYVDPQSFSSADAAWEGFPDEVSLPYKRKLHTSQSKFTSQSTFSTREDTVNYGTRRTTTVMPRGTNIDEDDDWRWSQIEGRSFGSCGAQPAQPSHGNSVQQKLYIVGDFLRRTTTATGGSSPRIGRTYSSQSNSNCRTSSAHSYADRSRYIEPREQVRSRDRSFISPSNSRQRRNAMKVKTHDRPSGIYKGDRFYVQYGSGLWETVTIESWNHWNGTWQVRDNKGHTMQAASIALKTYEQYRYLSKERDFGNRSFESSF